MPNLAIEKMMGKQVVGIDEVGRGSLAGPVTAAAVIIDQKRITKFLYENIDDSKKISPKKRRFLYKELVHYTEIGIGHSSVSEIDKMNILQASLLAMKRAFENLNSIPDYALIDGNFSPNIPCNLKTIKKGDSKSLSIAAASIVAKVVRDEIMSKLAMSYPGYGLERNAGYGTAEHISQIRSCGISPHHRKTFNIKT